MNNEDLLCAALDNTLIQQDEKAVKNTNSYQAPEDFPKAYSGQNDEKQGIFIKGVDSDQRDRKNVMTLSYDEISLDQELHNSTKNNDERAGKSEVAIESDKIFTKIKQKADSNSSIQHKISGSPAHIQDSVSSENHEINIHDEYERDDIEEDVMSGSYGEISLDRELLSSNKNSDSQSSKEDLKNYPSDENKSESINEEIVKEKKRPDSLVLTQNLLASQNEDFASSSKEGAYVQQMHKSQQTSECRTSAEVSPSLSSEEFALHSMGHVRSGSDTSGLSELQGTLTVDGDLVTFVAEDLQEKIKMSSPVSRVTDSSSFPGSRSSTPSLYRQALQPQFHIVDPHVISDLESHAKKVATVVDTMLENLSETLQSFSSLTVACMGTYESAVCKTCDAVDSNIKSVYQLMAKCEELSNSMQPLNKISGDVKHIKKMLDQLEHVVEHKS